MIHSTRILISSFIITGWLAALLLFSAGCSSSAEKEADPVVSVQTTPAERTTISETVSAEAVVYPIEQANSRCNAEAA
jgi:multidrug efflux pump subunit AcrA (membrane-fusion protein)